MPVALRVRGVASGVAGTGVTLTLNETEQLTVTADGDFEFATSFQSGDAFSVVVTSEPTCPERYCQLTAADGALTDTDATVTLTCAEPRYRLFARGWNFDEDGYIRVTDDLQSYADGATATPRFINGPTTELTQSGYDGLAYDRERDTLYTTTPGAILVFEHASTIEGDIAPSRRITVPAVDAQGAFYNGNGGLEFDPVLDRLYVTQSGGVNHDGLYILDDVSTLDGLVASPTWIPLNGTFSVTLDPVKDVLYVTFEGSPYGLYVFDHPATLTSASTPSRTISWPDDFLANASIDTCHDRLYLGSNVATLGGHNLFAFDNPGALDGGISLEAGSVAQLTTDGGAAFACGCTAGSIITLLDSAGRLYAWPDAADYADLFDHPEAFVGASSPTPDKRINGVLHWSFGAVVSPY